MRLPTSKFQKHMQQFYYRLGVSIGTRPWLYVSMLMVFTMVSCFGFLRFHQINNARVTFTAHDSPSHRESSMFSKFLKQNGTLHMIDVIVSANDDGNLMRGAWRNQLADLINHIQNNLTTSGGLKFEDMCQPYCNKNDVLLIIFQVFDESHESNEMFELKYPTSTILGHRLFLGSSVYGVVTEASTRRIISFNKVALKFYLSNFEMGPMLDFENQLIDLVYNTTKYPLLQGQVGSDVQVAKEVKKLGTASAPYLVISLLFLIAFLSVCSLRHQRAESKPIEACLGALIPVLSAVATIGVVSATGVPFQSIVVSTVFLVLAIGIDDVFIILSAWNRSDRAATTAERMGRTVEEAGCSMTVTTVTNLISFGNGVLSTTPVLQTFAIYSSAASVICFIYQLLLFPAIIAITSHREKSTSPRKQFKIIKTTSELGARFWCWLSKNIETLWMRSFVIATLLVYWFLAAKGILTMKTDLSIQKMADKSSRIVKFRDVADATLREMQTVAILVNAPGDLRNSTNLLNLQKMVHDFEHAGFSYGAESTVCWLSQYLKFLDFYEEDARLSYRDLAAFLKVEPYFEPMLRYDPTKCATDEQCVDAFIFTTGFVSASTYNEIYPLLQEWRRIAANYPQFEIYPYTEKSTFADQTNDMVYTIWQTVLSEVVCMTISFTLFIPDTTSIIAATLSLISVNLGVFGFLSLLDVGMDPITLAALLMSIGFSVDISAHISYHLYQVGDLRNVYTNIGWSTCQGAVSTMLAMLPIIFSGSYLADVFLKTVVLVTTFGLVHGLVVLPIFVSVVSETTGSLKKKKKRISISI